VKDAISASREKLASLGMTATNVINATCEARAMANHSSRVNHARTVRTAIAIASGLATRPDHVRTARMINIEAKMAASALSARIVRTGAIARIATTAAQIAGRIAATTVPIDSKIDR
jgi:hypothetical protein